MLRPPLLSTWDGLLRHRSTLHGTPLPAFVQRGTDCKVRRAAPALGRPRPQQAPPSHPTPPPQVQPHPSCARPIPHQFQLCSASMPDPTPAPAASIPLLGPVLSRPPAPGPELTAETGEPALRFPQVPGPLRPNWAQGQPSSGGPARRWGFCLFVCFEEDTPHTSHIPFPHLVPYLDTRP